MMQQFWRFVVSGLLILFFIPSSQAQQILQVFTTPLTPSECDSIQVTAQGQFPQGQNYTIQKTQVQQSGTSTEIILTYGQGTSPIPVPTFIENIELAPLPKGSNQINVILKSTGGPIVDNNTSNIQVSALKLQSGFSLPMDSACEQSSFSISDGSNNADEYIWIDNGTVFDTVPSPTYQALDTGTHTIKQIAVNGVCRDTLAKTLEILSTPKAKLGSADTQKLCDNKVDTLTSKKGYNQYQWRKDDSLLSSHDSSQLVITEGGLYELKTEASNGCSDSASLFIDEKTTTTPSITKTDSSLSSTPAFSYQWLRNGEPIPNATNSTYTAQESGDFRVVTFTKNGCSDTSAPTTVIYTSIPELDKKESLTSYPSPAQDQLHYNVNMPEQGQNAFITLYDRNGRTITHEHLSYSSQKGTIAVDDLAKGLYLLQLQTETTTITKKVVIK